MRASEKKKKGEEKGIDFDVVRVPYCQRHPRDSERAKRRRRRQR